MIAALIPALAPILDRALSALLPDPLEREKQVSHILGQFMQADVAQLEVNKAEAASSSIFVAGWRPFIGWVCGTALAYQFLFVPLVVWIGFLVGHPVPKPPTLDGNLWELMTGMLGLGALRSLEKIKRR